MSAMLLCHTMIAVPGRRYQLVPIGDWWSGDPRRLLYPTSLARAWQIWDWLEDPHGLRWVIWRRDTVYRLCCSVCARRPVPLGLLPCWCVVRAYVAAFPGWSASARPGWVRCPDHPARWRSVAFHARAVAARVRRCRCAQDVAVAVCSPVPPPAPALTAVAGEEAR